MNPTDWTWIFVGCGGTFWAATPYLAVLLRRFNPGRVIFIDPDRVTEENRDRQWTNLIDPNNGYKVDYCPGTLGLNLNRIDLWRERFTATDEDLRSITGRVLCIVNTDNNQSRLDVREWCRQRTERVAGMVVSGCDAGGGQAYWGCYFPRPAGGAHDWLALHPDVAEEMDGEPRPGCGGQTIYANALTGQLVGLAIENFFAYLDGEQPPKELYWSRDAEKGLRVWERSLKPNGGPT